MRFLYNNIRIYNYEICIRHHNEYEIVCVYITVYYNTLRDIIYTITYSHTVLYHVTLRDPHIHTWQRYEMHVYCTHSFSGVRVLMSKAYLAGTKTKYRITLEVEVLEDMNPHQIQWEKVLKLEPAESVRAYVEDLSTPDRWWGIIFNPPNLIQYPSLYANNEGFFVFLCQFKNWT